MLSYLPFVYDKLFPSKELSVVIVVTPLKAMMKDQVSEKEPEVLPILTCSFVKVIVLI